MCKGSELRGDWGGSNVKLAASPRQNRHATQAKSHLKRGESGVILATAPFFCYHLSSRFFQERGTCVLEYVPYTDGYAPAMRLVLIR